jgi:hypothetical protein
MNTKSTSGCLQFLRSIKPLDFDPELAVDYLRCLQSDTDKALVVDELEEHYSELEDVGERRRTMDVIANPNVSFDYDDYPQPVEDE